ncbi:MAG: polysaccharide biosynthesis/export family protein, partial [Deltaproteobacteria bacterium]|nr:polysaccharide biosynthesis/export family protein [Deltaproteobacteria bacterium]
EYPINREGYIILPIVGDVKVQGLTEYELMQTLQEKLQLYLRNPFVYVRPLIRLTMQGFFNRPGSYRIDPTRSLWDLVQLAGGPARNSNLEKMRVERSGRTVFNELLVQFERGFSLEEIGIESGDQIIVPERGGLNLPLVIGIVNLAASVALLYLRIRFGNF